MITPKSITTISFDGMHRSGKGTQIQLLKEYLNQQEYNVFSMRGEYYRFGSGDNPIEDPLSEWWQKNKYEKCYKEKSEKLQRELHITLNRTIPQHIKDGRKTMVILDRSIIGRYLMNSTESHSDIDSESILNYSYGNHKKYTRQALIPDHMFLLKSSQNVLLERLSNSTELFKNHEELLKSDKYDMIINHYQDYYGGINNIPESIKSKIHILDADQPKEIIHAKIIDILGREFSHNQTENSVT